MTMQPGEQPVDQRGIEDVNPQLIEQLITLNEGEVIVPLRMKREDVHKMKAVKVSGQEEVTVGKFQRYLYERGFVPDNTFASLFVYLFNLGYTLHRRVAEEEAKEEAKVQ